MSAESEAQSITAILAGFTSAESVAEDVIELILTEGGRQLYESYIDRKSFSFGSEAISNILISELKMCFVRHDEGEPPMLADARSGAEADVPLTMEVPSVPEGSETASPIATSERLPTLSLDMEAIDASSDATAAAGHAQVAPASASASSALPAGPPEAASRESPASVPLPANGDAGRERPAGADSGRVGASASVPDDSHSAEVSCFSWELEMEPERCRIDTWARSCVPVRRTLVRPKSKLTADSGRKQVVKTAHTMRGSSTRGTPVSITNLRSANMLATPSNAAEAKKRDVNDGMIPLVETVEHDEEETAMREMKEREAKRKREEENRIQRKVVEEGEEAARLAQVKDQMKNKPYTYDSAGNIIWVTAFPAEKLPSANPVPSYVLRREVMSEELVSIQKVSNGDKTNPKSPRKTEAKDATGRKYAKGKAKSDMDFVDTFKKFNSQQPLMMEAMKMAPGVRLHERGMVKNGEDASAQGKALMTRRDYESLVQSGNSGYPKEQDESNDVEGSATGSNAQGSATALPEQGEAAGPGEHAAHRQSGDGQKDTPRVKHGGVKAVGPTSATAAASSGLVPHAPSTPRPVQPAPPPSLRRVQLKREAVGYNLSSRERMPTGTGSRFPGCAAPPLLGATMGHGLLPQISKDQEYYFPDSDKPQGHSLRIVDEEDASIAPLSAVGSPRSLHGHIVSKNPELIRRLLNR